MLLKVSIPLLWRQVRQAHSLKDFSLSIAGDVAVWRVEAVPRSPKAPSLFLGAGGDALVGRIATGCHHQGDGPALIVSSEDIDTDAAGGVHHELFLGAVCPSPFRTKSKNSLHYQYRDLIVDRVSVLETRDRNRINPVGLPPEKESSCNVRLELKIKGVNHGQEIAFSGADHQ